MVGEQTQHLQPVVQSCHIAASIAHDDRHPKHITSVHVPDKFIRLGNSLQIRRHIQVQRRGRTTTTRARVKPRRRGNIARKQRARKVGRQEGLVDAAHLGQPHAGVLRLPLRPDLVKIGMVEIEERVAGRRDGIAHLGAHARMAGIVRRRVEAVPEVDVSCLAQALVAVLRVCRPADKVGDGSGDAVVRDGVAFECVGIVGKGACGDAARGADAVAAEAVLGVEDDGAREGAGVEGLVPVAGSVRGRWCVLGGVVDLRLGALVAALRLQGVLVSTDEEAVIWEELALEKG